MKIGYARISTDKQSLRMQKKALKDAGCEKIFSDSSISGSAVFKPEYEAALAYARKGDELVVFKLDRLSRKLSFLLEEIERIDTLGIGFTSLHERIDTGSPGGKLFFHMVGAFAEFEREQLRERTNAGLDAARKAGKSFGRPRAISEDRWNEALTLLNSEPPASVATVAKLLGVSRQTVYTRINAEAESVSN